MTWDSGRPYPQRSSVCSTKRRHINALYTALVLAGYHVQIVHDDHHGLALEVFLPDSSDSFLLITCRQIKRHWRFRAGPHLPELGVADDIEGTVRRLRELIGPPRPAAAGYEADGEFTA